MKIVRYGLLVTAAMAPAAAPGATQRPIKSAPTKLMPSLAFMGAPVKAMSNCLTGRPPAGTWAYVKLTVPDGYNPLTTGGGKLFLRIPIETDNADDLEETEDKRFAEQQVEVASTIKIMPFHLNMQGRDLHGKSWVKIKIVLREKGYTFGPGLIGEDPWVLAHTPHDTPGKQTIFCEPNKGVMQSGPDKGKEFVSFFVKAGGPNQQYGSYAFRLTPTNNLETPIFIDPKVRNDG